MLQFIMLVGPGCAGALLYSILSGEKNNGPNLAVAALGFGAIANLITYVVIWQVGQENLVWTFDRQLDNVYFCVQYMAVSLMSACLSALLAAGFEYIAKAVRKK